MPAYNAEKTIQRTIDSVLNQKTNERYELIIVNDHSTDQTEKICKENEGKNPDKIRYYKNIEGKKGVSSARNLGIKMAESQYLMFIDDDDCYSEKMIATMVKAIEENNEDLVVCAYKRILVDIGKEHDIILKEECTNKKEEITKLIEKIQTRGLFNQLWNKIFKADIIKNNQIKFMETISVGEDYRFILEYCEKITRIRVIDQILYDYYSTTRGLNLRYFDQKLKIKLDNVTFHKKIYIKQKSDLNYINKLYLLTLLSGYSDIIKNKDRADAIIVIEEYTKDVDIKKEIDCIYKETKSIKIKMLAKLLKNKTANFLYRLGKMTIVAKKIYRKIKFE